MVLTFISIADAASDAANKGVYKVNVLKFNKAF